MATIAIKIENVTKTFKESKVLDNISVNFESGEIHGLIGRNGSGKTMLLKCICGFVTPTCGKIYVMDKQVGKDIDVPIDVGIIIESPGFLPNYSGYKNLKILSLIKNQIKKDDIFSSMEKVGLDPQSKKWVGKYSLGMRQRLGIAQAIMENPKILILDEPMNGLDRQGAKDIRRLLLSLKDNGITIILASHVKEDIETLCDTVHELDNGIIIPNTTTL